MESIQQFMRNYLQVNFEQYRYVLEIFQNAIPEKMDITRTLCALLIFGISYVISIYIIRQLLTIIKGITELTILVVVLIFVITTIIKCMSQTIL